MPGPRKAALAACILLALTLAAYSNSFDASFQFDDYHQVVKNPHIRYLSNLPSFFTDAGTASYLTGEHGYRPLTLASFAFNYAVSGNDVRSYHALNLLLHFVNAFLVFLIVGMVMKKSGEGDPFPIALFSSLIFVLHPIQTNSVTYVSGRAVLLAGMFYLLAFYSFLRYRAAGGSIWLTLSPAFYLLGLLSKEMAVSLPVACLACDLIFPAPGKKGTAGSLKKGLYYTPYIAALVAYLAVRRAVSGFVTEPTWPYSQWVYLISESKALLLYARLLLLPVNQNIDHQMYSTPSVDALVVVAALVVAAALFSLYRLRLKNPAAAFFGLWFFIALAPESSLVPITDIAVEYRLYLPSIGFIAALVMLGSHASHKIPAMKKAAVVLPLLLLTLTLSRNSAWATGYTLWSDSVKRSPGSVNAHANLAKALIEEHRYEEAEAEIRRTIEMDPSDEQVYNQYNNLGACYMATGDMEDALTEFERAIKANPGYIEPYANIGDVYYRTGRYGDAVTALLKATALRPEFSRARLLLAKSYARLGRGGDALKEMETAFKYAPKDYVVSYDLAVVYEINGMMDSALRQAVTAISLAPDEAQRKNAEALLSRLRARGQGTVAGGR